MSKVIEKLDREKRHKLRKFINILKKFRGRHTELVSVYIPSGYDINKIISHLMQEQGTASNIKDKNNRKNVIDALERMIRHLRLFKQTPINGLAIFSGNISEQEGKQDIQVWSIEPPLPFNVRLYRCDHIFVLEELEGMIEHEEEYGLVVMDNREAVVGLLKGTKIIVMKEFTSSVPGKIKVGGQSQARYSRLREEASHEFQKRITAFTNEEFLKMKDLKGILVGGGGMTKDKMVDSGLINNEIKKKIIAVRDLSYNGEFGLRELVEKSRDVLAEADVIKEKLLVEEFLGILAKTGGRAIYGLNDVKNALQLGAVDKLLISEDIDEKVADELEDLADRSGTEFHIISIDTEEGAQIKNFGGIVAILRYSLE
ncbi:MAG TPA: peptide chain release factor aRF-1 [Candidatus Nanoarchaeia archaeon]|nr:peptide chain release factor aRF-1 [Candidatus Nanoarchaeia archaeon]